MSFLVVGQEAGERLQAPPGERLIERFGSGGGRRDDELLVVNHHAAGTATRPLRVQ